MAAQVPVREMGPGVEHGRKRGRPQGHPVARPAGEPERQRGPDAQVEGPHVDREGDQSDDTKPGELVHEVGEASIETGQQNHRPFAITAHAG